MAISFARAYTVPRTNPFRLRPIEAEPCRGSVELSGLWLVGPGYMLRATRIFAARPDGGRLWAGSHSRSSRSQRPKGGRRGHWLGNIHPSRKDAMPGLSAADVTKATQLSSKAGRVRLRCPGSLRCRAGRARLGNTTARPPNIWLPSRRALRGLKSPRHAATMWMRSVGSRRSRRPATGSQMHSRPSATRGSSHSRTAAAQKGRPLIYDRSGPRDERE